MKPKSKKADAIGAIIMAVLLVLIIVMDSLCYVYSNMINLFFRETVETDIGAVELSAQQVTTDINAEGTVLLKNGGDLLPISGNVNLFGACSHQQLCLGTGSAGGWSWNSESCVHPQVCTLRGRHQLRADDGAGLARAVRRGRLRALRRSRHHGF